VSKVRQYLKPSQYAPKQSHYAQLCSRLFGYHYAQNYASIIHQGLTSLALVTNCCVITILMLLFPNTFNMCNCVFTLIVHSQSDLQDACISARLSTRFLIPLTD